MKFIIAICMLIISTPALSDKIDTAILSEMEKNNIPGLAVSIVKNGKIIKERGCGYINIENSTKATEESLFQSGSTGKQFTASLVMLLAAERKIDLDEYISRYLPNTPAEWKKIKVRHLLSHTSGLADPYENLDMRKDYSEEELFDIEKKIPLLFEPGEKWEYSNMGYHLLGFICSKVGGKFYGDQLQEKIFSPLNMKARIINERDIVPHRANGYDLIDGKIKNQNWVSPSLNTTADGSVYLSAHDFALWNIALDKEFPLSSDMKKVMWSPVRLNNGTTHNYGYGWHTRTDNGKLIVEHSGEWQGFTAKIVRILDENVSVVILVNRSAYEPDNLAYKIAKYYVPDFK